MINHADNCLAVLMNSNPSNQIQTYPPPFLRAKTIETPKLLLHIAATPQVPLTEILMSDKCPPVSATCPRDSATLKKPL